MNDSDNATHSPRSSSAVHVLINPRSGGGAGARRAQDAMECLRAAGIGAVAHETRRSGDEMRIADLAIQDGARALAIVGGDGTVSHAARSIVRAGSSVPLALFSAGTGNDLVRTLGIPSHDFAAMAALVARGMQRRIDAGMVDNIPFINATGLGFDTHVLQRMAGHGAPRSAFAQRASYARAALGALRAYRGIDAAVSIGTAPQSATGATVDRARYLMLVFANARYFGGAFHIAPRANVEDGVLDMVTIADAGTTARLALFARAIRGTHVARPETRTASASDFAVHCDEPPMFEADGELHQAQSASVRIRCLPGALRIVSA